MCEKKIYRLGYYDFDGWEEELYHQFETDHEAIDFFTGIFNELKKITSYDKGYEIWEKLKNRFNDPDLNISFACASSHDEVVFILARLDPMTKELQNELNWTEIKRFRRKSK